MSNQERRLMRRMGIVGGVGPSPYGQPVDPRANLVQETDWQRTRLAERLLEIGLEDTRIGDFTDCHKREPVTKEGGEVAYHEDIATLTLEEWFVKLANASMSAAEVIYPELPDARVARSAGVHYPAAFNDAREHVTDGGPCWCQPTTEQPLPAAAREGARTVLEREGGEAGRQLADEAAQLGRDLAAHGLEG